MRKQPTKLLFLLRDHLTVSSAVSKFFGVFCVSVVSTNESKWAFRLLGILAWGLKRVREPVKEGFLVSLKKSLSHTRKLLLCRSIVLMSIGSIWFWAVNTLQATQNHTGSQQNQKQQRQKQQSTRVQESKQDFINNLLRSNPGHLTYICLLCYNSFNSRQKCCTVLRKWEIRRSSKVKLQKR